MREILFKAKRLDNGEWVEGSCVNILNIHFYIFTGKLDISNGYLDFEKYSVNPETICQYTGLTDKNGNKIWEGDVVKCYSIDVSDRECEFVSDVIFEDGMWKIHESECCDSMLDYFDMSKNWLSHVPEIEVIGNIFDNPELLENK